MTAAAVSAEFGAWLAETLQSDDPVIVDYVTSIVAGDESDEERRDALEGILAGLLEDGVGDLCQEILAKWRQLNSKQGTAEMNGAAKKQVDLDDQLSKLMEKHNIEATVHSSDRQRSSLRDNDVKAAILKQYAEISDTEEEGAEEERPDGGGAPARNANREEVAREEQERREKLKAEAAAKRDKDKQDREKQKAQQAERKEKEKKRTIKGEKRR